MRLERGRTSCSTCLGADDSPAPGWPCDVSGSPRSRPWRRWARSVRRVARRNCRQITVLVHEVAGTSLGRRPPGMRRKLTVPEGSIGAARSPSAATTRSRRGQSTCWRVSWLHPSGPLGCRAPERPVADGAAGEERRSDHPAANASSAAPRRLIDARRSPAPTRWPARGAQDARLTTARPDDVAVAAADAGQVGRTTRSIGHRRVVRRADQARCAGLEPRDDRSLDEVGDRSERLHRETPAPTATCDRGPRSPGGAPGRGGRCRSAPARPLPPADQACLLAGVRSLHFFCSTGHVRA